MEPWEQMMRWKKGWLPRSGKQEENEKLESEMDIFIINEVCYPEWKRGSHKHLVAIVRKNKILPYY